MREAPQVYPVPADSASTRAPRVARTKLGRVTAEPHALRVLHVDLVHAARVVQQVRLPAAARQQDLLQPLILGEEPSGRLHPGANTPFDFGLQVAYNSR
jgi:hypothetical protein